MNRPIKSRHHALLVVLALAAAAEAVADGERRAPQVPLTPEYKQECGACHVPYAPRLLPPQSWQRLMGNLPNHFGTDASLDADTTKALSSWLAGAAANTRRAREAPPEDRITRSRWFVHEHDDVAAATWTKPAVKSAANCAACHTRAEEGNFSERHIRIPR